MKANTKFRQNLSIILTDFDDNLPWTFILRPRSSLMILKKHQAPDLLLWIPTLQFID